MSAIYETSKRNKNTLLIVKEGRGCEGENLKSLYLIIILVTKNENEIYTMVQ